METIIDYLKRKIRAAGSARWEAIADSINEGRAEDERVSVHLLRKIAYDDRQNPGVAKIQPLLDFFGAVDRGERQLPDAVESVKA